MRVSGGAQPDLWLPAWLSCTLRPQTGAARGPTDACDLRRRQTSVGSPSRHRISRRRTEGRQLGAAHMVGAEVVLVGVEVVGARVGLEVAAPHRQAHPVPNPAIRKDPMAALLVFCVIGKLPCAPYVGGSCRQQWQARLTAGGQTWRGRNGGRWRGRWESRRARSVARVDCPVSRVHAVRYRVNRVAARRQ
jgi:hypothetical protein